MLKDVIDRLRDLYQRTGTDWVLRVHHIVTEPTCPTVVIQPEGLNTVRYRVEADTIEQAVEIAVDRVHREIFLGEDIEPAFPISDTDLLEETIVWLISEWRRGNKPEIPEWSAASDHEELDELLDVIIANVELIASVSQMSLERINNAVEQCLHIIDELHELKHL